jgi:hypothetical protein
VAILLAWVTFPAGGVYPWVWIPAACGTLALALRAVRECANHDRVGPIELALAAGGLAIVVQIVPLPAALLDAIDPHASPLRRALWLMPSGNSAPASTPISIFPPDTMAAFGIFAAAALLFWTCRQVCAAGGTGRLVRSVAIMGLVASLAAIIQRAQSKELLYGIWRPLDAGARPFGPFVNRNHFATWAIMACPLVFGYLLARAPSAREGQRLTRRIVAAAEHLGTMRIWLATSVCLMTLAVLISTSRSGLVGLIAAVVVSTLVSHGRGHYKQTRRWMAFQAALLVAVVLAFANFGALIGRLDETLAPVARERGRAAVWKDTQRLINDFPNTGTGAGTYGRAIVAYQTSEPGYAIGQAHNHYLQLAAEGGLLLSLPAILTLGAFLWLSRQRLRDDSSSNFLVRAGAVAGVAGVLTQSLWETGLRMPANAMLFAVLAAIATHTPAPGRQEERS